MTPSILPYRLASGDRVAIVSPAGPVTSDRLAPGIRMLESWGLVPVLSEHAHARAGYLAGPDDDRRADLQSAIDDPTIRAVIATRGGYGTQRIVDDLDLDALLTDPKPIVGFSDLTALHLAVARRAGVVSFHGPGAAWDAERLGSPAETSLRGLLMGSDAPGVLVEGLVLSGGAATGVLRGGNLALLSASIGTVDQPEFDGAIVLLEDVGEPAYRIDRMLTQLRRARLLDGVAGIVLGETDVIGEGPSFVDIAVDRLAGLGVPMVGPVPVGHGADQVTLPLGASARLEAGRLVVPDPVTVAPRNGA